MEERIISLNTRGFKTGEIQRFVDEFQPLVLAINEHKQQYLFNLQIRGYTVAAGYPAFSSQRGSACLVRNGEKCIGRGDLYYLSQEEMFEAASVEIPRYNVVITSLYRSPNSPKTDFYQKLDSFAKYITTDEPFKRHIIAGDFNIDCNEDNKAKNVVKKYHLQFNIRGRTHERGKCLDNFITDFTPNRARILPTNVKLSDHRPIEMYIS
uniref:Endonuclease/exonuclease/phosphatase domain-containing protein n=1 Tax=Cuerna arida TaxID=1464854 RepID=A0A1B6EL88_9HEMI